MIRDEFMRHDELFTSDSLNPVEQDYLSRMQTDELSDVEYTRSLLNLGRMLEKHHQSKVVILIDEYDTPIRQGHSRNFYNEVRITLLLLLVSLPASDLCQRRICLVDLIIQS